MNWDLSDAKNRLSEVLTLADTAPQTIVRQDREYVILKADDYRKLTGQLRSFTDFLIEEGPRFDGLELMKRNPSPMRDPQI